MVKLNVEQEDFLQDKLNEVGSIQHEEDGGDQRSSMNLPMLNGPSDLAKKHATFDRNFYDLSTQHFNVNKGSDVTIGTSSNMAQDYYQKANMKAERQNRKKQ